MGKRKRSRDGEERILLEVSSLDYKGVHLPQLHISGNDGSEADCSDSHSSDLSKVQHFCHLKGILGEWGGIIIEHERCLKEPEETTQLDVSVFTSNSSNKKIANWDLTI